MHLMLHYQQHAGMFMLNALLDWCSCLHCTLQVGPPPTVWTSVADVAAHVFALFCTSLWMAGLVSWAHTPAVPSTSIALHACDLLGPCGTDTTCFIPVLWCTTNPVNCTSIEYPSQKHAWQTMDGHLASDNPAQSLFRRRPGPEQCSHELHLPPGQQRRCCEYSECGDGSTGPDGLKDVGCQQQGVGRAGAQHVVGGDAAAEGMLHLTGPTSALPVTPHPSKPSGNVVMVSDPESGSFRQWGVLLIEAMQLQSSICFGYGRLLASP